MGKTWELGPAPTEPGQIPPTWQLELTNGYASQTLTIHGSDLYRLNCRGCHGALGHGSPPEINAVTGPVQATSVTATMERMKQAGREMSRSDVSATAKESKILLLQRLHMGGLHMPPPTLSDAEIRSLIAYLEVLSDVPGAANRQIAVRESSYRIGEHIVKSTCHVCHSATGANPDPEQIYEGAIPPLSTLTDARQPPRFCQKGDHRRPHQHGHTASALQRPHAGLCLFDPRRSRCSLPLPYDLPTQTVGAHFFLDRWAKNWRRAPGRLLGATKELARTRSRDEPSISGVRLIVSSPVAFHHPPALMPTT